MAQRITAYLGHDGTVFRSKAEAKAYDDKVIITGQLYALLNEQFDERYVDEMASMGLIDYMVANPSEFVAALTVKRQRKPEQEISA